MSIQSSKIYVGDKLLILGVNHDIESKRSNQLSHTFSSGYAEIHICLIWLLVANISVGRFLFFTKCGHIITLKFFFKFLLNSILSREMIILCNYHRKAEICKNIFYWKGFNKKMVPIKKSFFIEKVAIKKE